MLHKMEVKLFACNNRRNEVYRICLLDDKYYVFAKQRK